jgi:hypothetical protein
VSSQVPDVCGEVVGASVFLLENGAVNGVDLRIDGGWRER